MNTVKRFKSILVVGATGSIGRLVISEGLQKGHHMRALVRSTSSAQKILAPDAQLMAGDLKDARSLTAALDGVDAVIFTHGTTGGDKTQAEKVDYGAVRNVLHALGDRQHVAIALMTAIGVTNRTGSYNTRTEIHDWKRRGERLLRASGLPYTIVRPGWFDYNNPDQLKLHFLQGDTRQAGTPSDGVVSRRQIARVLLASLDIAAAQGKTLELVAEQGPAQQDYAPLFAALTSDLPDEAHSFDAIKDQPNMPLQDEPERVRAALKQAASNLTSPTNR